MTTDPGSAAGPSSDSAAPVQPDRARSEAPARPPPPAGISSIRRDAITIALSSDGRFLAAGDLGGQALLWDLTRGRFLWADPTPEGNRIGRVVFAGVAPVYLGGSFHEPDRPWRFWSAERLERDGELGEPGWLGLDAALDDMGTRALTLSSSRDGGEQRLELWDLATSKALALVPVSHAARGSVALDAGGARFAIADERGGVVALALADDALGAPTEIFKMKAEAGTTEASRVSRLALSADGALLYGAVGARLMTWPLSGDATATAVVVGADPAQPTAEQGLDPIRGLQRVERGDGVALVAITRPELGGLRVFGGDGRQIAILDSGCRCEIHALSLDGAIAACGCAEVAELRWGHLRYE